MATTSTPTPTPTTPSPGQQVQPRLVAVAGAGAAVLMQSLFSALVSSFDGRLTLEPVGVIALLIVAPTLFTALVAGTSCLKTKRSGDDAMVACLGTGLASGPAASLLGGLILFCVLVIFGPGVPSLSEALISIVAGVVVAAVIGGPAGMLFSLPFIPLVRFGCAHPGSLDRMERADRLGGLWLTAIALLGAAVMVLSLQSRLWTRPGHSPGALLVLGLCLAAVIVGLALATRGQRRLSLRRRWLRRVEVGQEPDWSIRPVDAEAREALGGLPTFALRTIPPGPARVLSRRDPEAERGAYRTGDDLLPVALLD